MSNVLASLNEAFLNQILAGYIDQFSGSRVIRTASVMITYTALDNPVFTLPHSGDSGFIIQVPTLDFRLYRYRDGERGPELGGSQFELTVRGNFRLQPPRNSDPGGSIQIHIDDCEVNGGNPIGRAIVSLYINNTVIPALKARLPAVKIPNLRQLLGFPVTVDRVHTANRQLYLLMTVPDAPHPATPPPVITQTDEPSVFICATDAAITASQASFKVKRGVDEDTDFPLPMGVKLGLASLHLVGYVQADDLNVRIHSGEPSCGVNLTASAGLKVGMKPLGQYDLGLKPRITPPRFSLDLKSNDERIYAVIQMESSPLVNWEIPGIPRVIQPALRDLLGWVDSSMSMVYDTLDAGLRVIRIPIVSFADWSYLMHVEQVRFEGNSVLVHLVADQREEEVPS